MAILKGIKLSGSDEEHQIDYDTGIGNKPTLVKSFNDLEDKPFYSENGTVEIVPIQDYVFESQEDGSIALQFDFKAPFEVGKTYDIEWDGTTYNCVSQAVDADGATAIAIGNGLLVDGTDTGEPFVIMYLSIGEVLVFGVVSVYDTEATTHHFGITQTGEIVHKLDSKYVDAYTRGEIDGLVTMLLTRVDEMFSELVNGDEVAY